MQILHCPRENTRTHTHQLKMFSVFPADLIKEALRWCFNSLCQMHFMKGVLVGFSGTIQLYFSYGKHNVHSLYATINLLVFPESDLAGHGTGHNTAGLHSVTFHPLHTTGSE